MKASPGDSTRQVPLPARPAVRTGDGGGPASGGPRPFAGAPPTIRLMGIELTELEPLVRRALAEDVGSGDLTTQATVPAGARRGRGSRRRQPGVIYGLDAAERGVRALDPGARFERLAEEGVWRERRPRARHRGRGRGAARRRAHRAEPAAAPERRGDADRALRRGGPRHRRARPRHPQDDAGAAPAREGGGGAPAAATNHRVGLFDAILIKENHAAMAGGVGEAVRAARARRPGRPRGGRVPRRRARSRRRWRAGRRGCCWTT